jgi:UDP-sulfoquinovose synthase
MLNLKDTVRCIELALINPAKRGEYRVFNQFTESWSVMDLAEMVVRATGGRARIETLADPRVEAEDHYYRAAHTKLLDLGLVPHLLSERLIRSLLAVAERHAARILPEAIPPTVDWRRTGSPVGAL